MSSVKGNIILNGINVITGIIFPVMTFPYAARILLPEGIGAVNFLNSIINYIILLTSLGIPLYAVKEISRHRDNKELRDRATIEILILSVLLCIIGYIVVWILAKFVPEIENQTTLFFILSLSILFNAIGINWFYQAIEDFKFITFRAVIIRTLSALALFIFVKSPCDLLIYGLIVVGSTVGNNLLNLVHLHKLIKISKIKLVEINILRHIKPSLQLFIFNIIVSLYIHLNSVMLGFISGDEQVGFFSAGTRISHIGLTLLSSISTVLLPRCSNLIEKGDIDSFNSVINKSLNFILALSLPMSFGLMILAKSVTLIFCGSEYIESIPVLILNAPVIIFIGLSNLLGIQILYPKDKINIVIWSVAGGAVINILLNVILIPNWGSTGAAISTFFAELCVLVIQLYCGKNYYPFSIKSIFRFHYIISSLLMTAIIYIVVSPIQNIVMQFVLGTIIGVCSYVILLILFKDPLLREMTGLIEQKLRRT